MDRREKIKHINLPIKGYSSEYIRTEHHTLRMAEPIAALYKRIQEKEYAADSAVLVCKQAHYHLLMRTSKALEIIPANPQTIRAELRFQVGLKCTIEHQGAKLTGLLNNLSVHGAQIKCDTKGLQNRIQTGDELYVRIWRLEQTFYIPRAGMYKVRSIQLDSIACELIDTKEHYAEAILAYTKQIRWRNSLDQKDVFMLFLQLTVQKIRNALGIEKKQEVAFHILKPGAQMYSTSRDLPFSTNTILDIYITVPIDKTMLLTAKRLKQHSPVLYEKAMNILHGRIRVVVWQMPN